MESPKYAKTSRGGVGGRVSLKSAPREEMPVTLQVTLGEMELEDAFRVTLPSTDVRIDVGGFLDRVFGGDGPARDTIRASFDLKENPDLPEMYDAVLEVFGEWKSGRCALSFFANQGAEIALSDKLWTHLSSRGSEKHAGPGDSLFDLVIEQRYRPLDYAVRQRFADNKEQLVEWLQTHALLYYLDRDRFELGLNSKSGADQLLQPIARQLCDSNLLEPSQDTRSFEITGEGRQVLANMIGETETYIDRYDVFRDVLYDVESGSATFGTGRGEDLRVPVYEEEGLDPLRTVFLILLYDSALDGNRSDWREAITDTEFYDDVLAPVVDHQRVDKAHLESIIESGFAYVDEREEQDRRLTAQREAIAGPNARRRLSPRERNVPDAMSKLRSR